MRPMVKPALRRAWRGRRTVQFGVTPAHAVRMGPMDTATGGFLELLDGSRTLPVLRAEARAMGLPEEWAQEVVRRLAAAGVVDDPGAGGEAFDALRRTPGALERLRPDLASLSVVHQAPGEGAARLAARRAGRVRVRGAGRVGAAVAAALAAAGVGCVEVQDGGSVEASDVAPGGLPASAVGERRAAAAARLVRVCAPGAAPRGAPDRARDAPISLIVVAPRDALAAYRPEPAVTEPWVAAGVPHLFAGVIEATGFVGPLVLPGGTACAGCLLLAGAEADPDAPAMLAQWRSGRGARPVTACDGPLAALVAGLTAAHALAFLDGELPTSTGTRWEVSLPLLDWRSTTTAPHSGCRCGAAGRTEGVRTATSGAGRDTMAV
ncbi:ThiF family adenylyltransferase [Streptomyces sp. NBC_01497]|uniref:ThiF family adenylyltransferase n=1 Tax=Streptomyces sp. NBC_01497 TaxID=2903885 RepID=UPI002E31FD1F|nr:ThiF family adenylyltransferase [Streptomyces sp. NBC_01497]